MLRYVLAPRWIPLHLLTLGVMAIFLRFALWQWQVAQDPMASGSGAGIDLQNAFYALQWGLFAAAAGYFWWRFLRDERAAEAAHAAEMAAYEAAVRAQREKAAADGVDSADADPTG